MLMLRITTLALAAMIIDRWEIVTTLALSYDGNLARLELIFIDKLIVPVGLSSFFELLVNCSSGLLFL